MYMAEPKKKPADSETGRAANVRVVLKRVSSEGEADSPGSPEELRDGRSEDERTWREFLGPLLTSTQTQQRLGVSIQTLHQLVGKHELLALPTTSGEAVYPDFQFNRAGRVYPDLPRILAIFDGVVATSYTIASWLKGPKDYLGGEAPIRWLALERDPEPVIAGAEVAAARLAH
jgi:hypothetical protein